MKTAFFLVVFYFIAFNSSAQALTENMVLFTFAFTDTSNNPFFANHPQISQIGIEYKENKAVALYIYNRSDSTLYKKIHFRHVIQESYDLEFSGDTYLLKNKYKQIKFQEVPELIMEKMSDLPKCKQSGNILLSSMTSKDSVTYQLKHQCGSGNKEIVFRTSAIGLPPFYQGNIDNLKKDIQQYKKNIQLNQLDSILVFWGTVSRTGTLSNLNLLIGSKSPFSEFVRNQIEKPEHKWIPADISGRKTDSHIRIYIKLNNDGDITISTGPKLLIASGK